MHKRGPCGASYSFCTRSAGHLYRARFRPHAIGSQASAVTMERTFTGYLEMRDLSRSSKRNGPSQIATHLARRKWCLCELGRRSLGSWLERGGGPKWPRAEGYLNRRCSCPLGLSHNRHYSGGSGGTTLIFVFIPLCVEKQRSPLMYKSLVRVR